MIRGVSRDRRRIGETQNPVVLRADERLEVRKHFATEAFPVYEDAELDTFGQPTVPPNAKLFPSHIYTVNESNPERLGPCGAHELAVMCQWSRQIGLVF